MKHTAFAILISGAFLLQACTPTPIDTTGSSSSSLQNSSAITSSSKSSSSVSSSRSSSSSSVSVANPSLDQAKAAVSALSAKLSGLLNEKNYLAKPTSLLQSQNQAKYAAFEKGLNSSNLFFTFPGGDMFASDDVGSIINALTKVLTSTGIAFVDTIARGLINNETGIVINAVEVQPADEDAYPYWNFKFSGTVNPCAATVPACNVKVDLDLDLLGDASGTYATDVATLRIAEGYRFNIKKLTATKGDVTIGVKPGDVLTFAKNLDVKINLKKYVIETFNINSRDLNVNLPLWIRNAKTGYSVNVNLGLSTLFKMDINMAEGTDMAIILNSLGNASKLSLSADVSNAAGDKIALNSVTGLKMNGTSPITFTMPTDKPIKRSETATNYLGLDSTVNFDILMGGAEVISADINMARDTGDKFSVANSGLNLDGEQFALDALLYFPLYGDLALGSFEFAELGVNYLTKGLKTNLQYTVGGWSVALVGDLLDSNNQKLGVMQSSDHKYIINYTDGTEVDFAPWK